MPVQDVVVKSTLPLRIAEAVGTAPGYGHENLRPVFDEHYPRVARALQQAQLTPGLCVAWYEERSDDGTVTVHAGFGVDDARVPGAAVVDLPVLEVASVMYHGAMEDIGATYDGLMRWIDASGYQLAGRSRELYYDMCVDGDPARNVVEIQLPIARA
jgi:effector-binding domain-containing protein